MGASGVRQVRVVVIGAGSAAQVVHLPILKRLPDLEVAGLIEAQERKARAIAERFGLPHVGGDLSGLDEMGRVDAAVICTPTDTHESLVIDCLSEGLHVLCERPLALDSGSAGRMVEAAGRAERQLMVAMNLRYRFDVRAIRQFVHGGEIGEVFFVRAAAMNPRFRRPRGGWRREPARAGGGVLMDLGAPAIDVGLWLLGRPAVERVSARFHGGRTVEETAVAVLDLEGGITLDVAATWGLMDDAGDHSVEVLGTRGSARTSPFRLMAELETGLTDVTPPQDATPGGLYTGSYRQEWAEFLRFVRGEKPLEPTVDQIELHRVLEACYESARRGRDLSVDEASDRG